MLSGFPEDGTIPISIFKDAVKSIVVSMELSMDRCNDLSLETVGRLEAENKRLREALERLSNGEAFIPGVLSYDHSKTGQELRARMQYARDALRP